MKKVFCTKCGIMLFFGVIIGKILCPKCGYEHQYHADIKITGVLANPIMQNIIHPSAVISKEESNKIKDIVNNTKNA